MTELTSAPPIRTDRLLMQTTTPNANAFDIIVKPSTITTRHRPRQRKHAHFYVLAAPRYIYVRTSQTSHASPKHHNNFCVEDDATCRRLWSKIQSFIHRFRTGDGYADRLCGPSDATRRRCRNNFANFAQSSSLSGF